MNSVMKNKSGIEYVIKIYLRDCPSKNRHKKNINEHIPEKVKGRQNVPSVLISYCCIKQMVI